MTVTISASVHTEYENGLAYMTTHYSASCGCMWHVDHWGYVRSVMLCERDRDGFRWLENPQLTLLADSES